MAKILYLSPYFWPEEIGSSPYSIDLAVWLKQHGNDVQVVAFRPHYPSPDLFLPWADGTRDQEQYEGVAITRVAVRERGAGGALARLRNDLSYLWSVLRWALTGKFSGTDTVFVYVPSVLGVYGARVVKWITKARVIAVVHDIESGLAAAVGLVNNRTIIRGMQLFERIGLNGADHVVVLTEGMKTALRAIGCKKPIDVISIWAELVPYVRPDRNKPFQILYSGNFGKKQGFFQLLPALQRISDENLPVTVVLRGGGSEKQALMDAITRRGIRNVVFDALVPKEKFIAALQAAHVHLVPQAQGGANYAIPSKLFSIMSAGRPFVCIAEKDSPLDCLARESGAGLCVRPSENGEELYQTLATLMNNPEELARMCDAGRQYVQKHMNRADILQRFTSLI